MFGLAQNLSMSINILSKLTHPIFKDFTLSELDNVLKIAKITIFNPEDVLIKEGEFSQILFIILNGKVIVTKEDKAQEQPIRLATLGADNVLGEISVLTGKPRTATVTAIEETTVLELDISTIEKQENTKELYTKLIKNLTSELSEKLVYSNGKVVKYNNTQEEGGLLEDKLIRPPNTILVLFGWKWSDILYEIPFLAQHGYDAIKISPPQEFVVRANRPWWEIYQPVSYNLSTFYGNEEEFRAMIDFCHNFNIKVYVDLVINHMADYVASDKEHCGTNGNIFRKYHYEHLNKDNDSYEFNDFYHFKEEGNLQTTDEDYAKLERSWHLEHYDLLELPKLNIENPHVVKILQKYVKYLLNLGVDGFRLDAAKHLNISSVEKILSGFRTNDGFKPFVYQEYYIGSLPIGIDVYSYMNKYFKIGYVTSFNYGAFLSDAIKHQNNNLQKLVDFAFGSSWIHYPENRTVVVLDNHDTERMMSNILNYKCTENNAYVLAYIFMLAWPFGIPKVMSSFHFKGQDDPIPTTPIWQNGRNTCFDLNSPWVCQHRWNAIANMVLFRNKVKKAKGITHVWTNGNQIAFARSYQKPHEYVTALGFVVINATDQPLRHKFETGLPKGEYFNLITSQIIDGKMRGPTILVEDYGLATIDVNPHDAVVFCIDFILN